jgi:endonuclease/exonuclease/phosphatase family metal-dependent hydrolase
MMGDFNALPENDTVNYIINDAGFKSALREYHGEEPKNTFNTGLISPYMDPDPPCTVDYIFYKDGGCVPNANASVKLTFAKVMGDRHAPEDNTLYGSDHFPLIADFEFTINQPEISQS